MNSTNLYITTNQIILNSDPHNPDSWHDLYRLVPYLRNSLCCVVCGNLLVDPLTPAIGRCHHHLCRRCIGGRKKIKPACSWCKECTNYTENRSLRILLQCYKKMCIYLVKSPIMNGLLDQVKKQERGASNLISLIREGAAFQDEYESKGGLPKSTYSILPCVYSNTSTPTVQICNKTTTDDNNPSNKADIDQNIQHRSSIYSVMFAGTGNKITIKRKPKETNEFRPKIINPKKDSNEKVIPVPYPLISTGNYRKESVFKRPPAKCSTKPKKGCRCGNATLTPGKLTCCGQRCPCYVESKACIECKCRGCRNPHRPDGHKVRPHIPQFQQVQYHTLPQATTQPSVLEQELLPGIKLESLDMESLTFDHLGQKFTAYKVVPVTTDILLRSALEDDEISNEDAEIIVDV